MKNTEGLQTLLQDVSYNIITEELLEDEDNIELLEATMDNWRELIATIKRERQIERRAKDRWEVTMAELSEEVESRR